LESQAVRTIILGSNSDIAKAITPMLEVDGHMVSGWARGDDMPESRWDVLIITIGVVAPVGLWHDIDEFGWIDCISSNLTFPFILLRRLWHLRKRNATVIWFAGSNPQKIMDGYSAYNTSKMAVLKLVEQLDHETPDCKFVAFGPGYAKTKIHKATLDAKWPNERIARGDDGTSMEHIYKSLRWCIEQSKEAVGGRNICVSDLNGLYGRGYMERMLPRKPDVFKLRRIEDEFYS
jgi:NAD(P)-dependent dehydrogenase (short-subunit alcohol dehydrogenase family)